MLNRLRLDDFNTCHVRLIIARCVKHQVGTKQNRNNKSIGHRSWNKVFNNNYLKLQSFYNASAYILINNQYWKPVISFQIDKFKKRYQVVNRWWHTEFKILNKVNSKRFDQEYNTLWQHVACTQAHKVYNYRPRKAISPSTTFARFFSIKRDMRFHEIIDNSWNLSYKSNFEKIRMNYRDEGWEPCVREQGKKLSRISLSLRLKNDLNLNKYLFKL